MPRPQDRWAKRKFTRTPSGKVKMSFGEKKTGKRTCGLCQNSLLGVPHGKRKSELTRLSKTQKRPEGIFGGVLCSQCRTEIVEQTAKVVTGMKKIEDVAFVEKKFVEQAIKRVGG